MQFGVGKLNEVRQQVHHTPLPKKKFTETLKDVFLISDPSITTVPRRNSWQFYHKNGLVATAVQFDSSMDDQDVYKQIRKRFCKYEDLQFEFLKAVDDDLVNSGVEKVDYKTMKHITGQGPVYVRSTKKLLLDDEYNIDENYVEWEGNSKHSSFKFLVDNNIKLPQSSSKKVYNCPVQSELKVCPICFKRFPASDIEYQAAACAIKFDQDLDDSILEIYDSDETLEETLPYMVQCEEEKVEEVNLQENPASLQKTLTELHGKQKKSSHINLRIRRKYAWQDFINYQDGKKLFKETADLIVMFIGEPSIDTDGPRREFFSS